MTSTISSIIPFKEEAKLALLDAGFSFDVRPFVSEYKQRFPEIFQIFKLVGISPFEENQGKVNFFNGASDEEDFSNIGEHIIAATTILESLLKPLLSWEIITEVESNSALRMILIHDINRVFEIYERKAFNRPATKKSVEGMIEFLRKSKLSQDIVDLTAKVSIYTAFEGLGLFLEPDDLGNPVLKDGYTAGQLTRLADDMTCSRGGKHFVFPPMDRFIASGYFTEKSLDSKLWTNMKITSKGEIAFDVDEKGSSNAIIAQGAALHMVSANLTIEKLFSRPSCPPYVKEMLTDLGPQSFAAQIVIEEIKMRQAQLLT